MPRNSDSPLSKITAWAENHYIQNSRKEQMWTVLQSGEYDIVPIRLPFPGVSKTVLQTMKRLWIYFWTCYANVTNARDISLSPSLPKLIKQLFTFKIDISKNTVRSVTE